MKDLKGGFNCAVGIGNTEEAALNNTIAQFFKLTSVKEKWDESDFQLSDPFDF